KIAEQVFGNGAKFTTNGYEIAVTLGNPSGLRLSFNGKEVTYLRKLVTSEKIIINPITLKTIMEK
ncbi:MAG: hypothetical protein GY757_42505, partial [bacterium]|nr:hypothetical protein [bacterium]